MIASLPGLYFSYIRQAGMAALLEEKREAEAHAAEACRLLDEARAAASTAADRASALEAELRDAASQNAVDGIAHALEKGAAAEGARGEAVQVRTNTLDRPRAFGSECFVVVAAITPPRKKKGVLGGGTVATGRYFPRRSIP